MSLSNIIGDISRSNNTKVDSWVQVGARCSLDENNQFLFCSFFGICGDVEAQESGLSEFLFQIPIERKLGKDPKQ